MEKEKLRMEEVAWGPGVGGCCRRSKGPDGVGGGGSTCEPCIEAEGRPCRHLHSGACRLGGGDRSLWYFYYTQSSERRRI